MLQLSLSLLASFATLSTVFAVQNSLSSHPPLRCCFMDDPPISFRNMHSYWNHGLDGVIKEHLLQHQSYLNWTCSSMRLFNHPNPADFNAFVSMMHKCTNMSTGKIIDSPDCQCDIGIGGWFQTARRFGQVDFLPPFAFDQYVVFAHVSEATVAGKTWFFIQTFDIKAWTAIFGLFLMFSFLKILDNHFAVPAPYEPPPNTYSRLQRYGHYLMRSALLFRLRKAFQSTVMRMLSDDQVVENGNSSRQWFLNIILAASALFLVLSYEASMTAYLVQESIKANFESASDLVICNVDPSEICILRGGALERYWQKSIAIDECHMNNPPQYYDSYGSLFEAVKEDGSVDFQWYSPKGSNLTESMTEASLDLLEHQTIPNLNRFFNNLPQCLAEVNITLSFNKLRLFFIIAYSFGGFLFLVMVLMPQPAVSRSGDRTEGKVSKSVDLRNSCSTQS